MSIRFGVCTGFENIPLLIKAGYDYLEFNFTTLVNMTDAEFNEALALTKKHNFYAECFNCFFPWDTRLTGEDVDFERITCHIKSGMARAMALGGKVCVIGSGGSRKIPDGFDFQKGYEQFAKVLSIAGNISYEYGIMIAVEPLNSGETNLINTVAQGIELVKRVNCENVKCLADFYHVFKSGETLDAIENNEGFLGHLHLARADNDRAMPYEEDSQEVKKWAEIVKKSGYSGRMSLEGSYLPEFCECITRTRRIIDCFKV